MSIVMLKTRESIEKIGKKLSNIEQKIQLVGNWLAMLMCIPMNMLVVFSPGMAIRSFMPIYAIFGKYIQISDIPFAKPLVQIHLHKVIPAETTVDKVLEMLERSTAALPLAILLSLPFYLSLYLCVRWIYRRSTNKDSSGQAIS